MHALSWDSDCANNNSDADEISVMIKCETQWWKSKITNKAAPCTEWSLIWSMDKTIHFAVLLLWYLGVEAVVSSPHNQTSSRLYA